MTFRVRESGELRRSARVPQQRQIPGTEARDPWCRVQSRLMRVLRALEEIHECWLARLWTVCRAKEEARINSLPTLPWCQHKTVLIPKPSRRWRWNVESFVRNTLSAAQTPFRLESIDNTCGPSNASRALSFKNGSWRSKWLIPLTIPSMNNQTWEAVPSTRLYTPPTNNYRSGHLYYLMTVSTSCNTVGIRAVKMVTVLSRQFQPRDHPQHFHCCA